MKITATLIALTVLTFKVYSQNLLENGKTWNVFQSYTGTGSGDYQIYSITDTVNINNIDYFTISDPSSMSVYSLRETSDSKVFWYDYDSGTEKLLYDFDVQQGEIVNLYPVFQNQNSKPYLVDSITMTTFAGQLRKTIYLTNEYVGNEIWYQGVGSSKGILYSAPGSVGVEFTDLLCYYENNVMTYINPDYNDCFYIVENVSEIIKPKYNYTITPNPAKDYFVITIKDEKLTIKDVEIYAAHW